MSRSYSRSLALFERAARVIPGGMYGHTHPAAVLPLASPYYAARGEGCRYWDVDGNEYIDFLCAYGPMVLGYHHPEVEAAAEKQRARGDCFNHPTELAVQLAERLVALVDFAAWAVFGKNGSDMTTWSLQVAREHTGRKKILRAHGSYHGSHAWCTPGHGGLIEEDQAHIHGFMWNDLEDFSRSIKEHRGQIAGVIVTPFHHPAFGDSILPARGFLQEVEATCRREGIVLILDDVRGGFRLHTGGSHRYFDFEPDLICFSKALGNGYPISAALGRAELQRAAGRVFLTGSFWNNAVPMAAALACLEIFEREDVPAKLAFTGGLLREGMERLAAKHNIAIRYTGPDAMPFLSFSDETNFFRSQVFCKEAIRRGVFFHPHHNWFLSAAHEELDVAEALESADAAFEAVQMQFTAKPGCVCTQA
jgi:glutamate-1-semialdehyde 2,1-aminomutase